MDISRLHRNGDMLSVLLCFLRNLLHRINPLLVVILLLAISDIARVVSIPVDFLLERDLVNDKLNSPFRLAFLDNRTMVKN